MTGKKIAVSVLVLVLVLVGLVLALAIGVISAPDVSEGPVMMPAVKNASVSPQVGNYTDSFNYSVAVRFYEEALIELQLYDPTKKDWITHKTREYRDKLSWETLRWNWIPSDRAWEGENVSYRFRWNNTKLLYDGQGPYIKEEIEWEFRNAIVRPSSGYYNDNFSYSVSVKLNKEEEISLEVFNIANYTWDVRGKKQYTNTGNWRELKWDNIANIASADSEGLASYRFFFMESGERHESGIYYGPTLKPIIHEEEEIFKNATAEEIFKNATVYPSKGDFSTAFNYTVEVINTYGGIEINNVTLEVYNGSWRHKGPGTSRPGGNRWEWNDITFGEGYEGVAKYKFLCNNKYESAIYDGPLLLTETPTIIISGGGGGGGGGYIPESKLKEMVGKALEEEEKEDWKRPIRRSKTPLSKPNITCNVTPKTGRWFKTFKYNATIKHPDRANMSLGLFIYKPGSGTWGLVEYKPYSANALIIKDKPNFYNAENVTHIVWESTGIFDEKDVDSLDYQYYIWYWDGWNEEESPFYGPANVAENHEPSVEGSVTPETGTFATPFKYTAYINDTDGDDMVDISLHAKDSSNEMVPIGEKSVKIKSGKGNITWVVPSDKYPAIFSAEALGNESFNSSFYFEYSDEGMEIEGIGKNRTESIPGPLVQPANVTFIEAIVIPGDGKYSDKFTYTAEFYSSHNNTITATLRIYDPSNIPSNYKDYEKKEIGTGPLYITWSDVSPEVFGPDDFNKTAEYSIAWRDKILYTEGKKEGPWRGPNITKGIPIAGGVVLPLALIIGVPLFIPLTMFIIQHSAKKTRKRKSVETKGAQEQEGAKKEAKELK